MVMDTRSTPRSGPSDNPGPGTVGRLGLVTLLFGLSLATALPAAALLAPPGPGRPTVRSETDALLDPPVLTEALGRPTIEVLRGRVALGEVDRRLGGLEIALSVFQVTDGSGGLVCLSAIKPDPDALDGGATAADVWDLACRALAQYGTAYERIVGIGEDAFLAIYGGVTAQVAWIDGDRLATASVTCLGCDQDWAVEGVRSIAAWLDRRLTR
jgi:hypothetical protein